MGAFLDLLACKPQLLWLDSHAYCERLLAGGSTPWLDAAAFVAWQRKAQGLLKPDVAVLPLAPVIEAWLASHPALREAMAGKSRATYPLKILLAEEPLRAHLVDLARGLRAGVAGVPLALVLPSPRAWVELSYQQAHGKLVEAGEDEADSASVYMADFLRVFGEAGVDALLLQEAEGFAPAAAQDFDCYQSVLNVAAHYRWDVGLQLAGVEEFCGSLPEGCSFAIAPKPLNGKPTAVPPPESFWTATAPPTMGAFRYARIPVDAQPESVLERLAALR